MEYFLNFAGEYPERFLKKRVNSLWAAKPHLSEISPTLKEESCNNFTARAYLWESRY